MGNATLIQDLPPVGLWGWLILIVAACGIGTGSGGEDRLVVVATTTILGDVVENVVGDDARVEVLTPVGADPHDFQPSPAQIAELNRADLVVANGLGLEEGLEDVLEAAAGDGIRVFEVGLLVEPIPLGSLEAHRDEHEEEHEDETEVAGGEHEHAGVDPHIWLDPLRMADAARLIAAQLAEIDPAIDWMGRAGDYAAQLAAADEEISGLLSLIPHENRLLVTNHEALGYFAHRYDFEVVGVIIPGGSTLADPSSARLAELVEVMRQERVTVIFGETTEPSVLAEAVAAELGEDVAVIELFTESLGEPGSGAETLIGMMHTNAILVAEALG